MKHYWKDTLWLRHKCKVCGKEVKKGRTLCRNHKIVQTRLARRAKC